MGREREGKKDKVRKDLVKGSRRTLLQRQQNILMEIEES